MQGARAPQGLASEDMSMYALENYTFARHVMAKL